MFCLRLFQFIFVITAVAAKLLELNRNSYLQLLSEFEYSFIYFYSPYIPHHTSINNEFKKLVQYFPQTHPSARVGFGKVQCLIEYVLCSNLELDGFPLFILYSHSKPPLLYTKARRFESMIAFIASKTSNHNLIQIITPNSEMTDSELVTKHTHALIGYHLSRTNIDTLQSVLHSSQNYAERVHFAVYTNNGPIPQKLQTLVFYRNGQEWLSISNSENELNSQTMHRFIEYALLPHNEALTPHNYVTHIHSKAQLPLLWLWIESDHKSVNNPLFATVSDLLSQRRMAKLEPFGSVYSDAHKFQTHFLSLDWNDTNTFPKALFIYDNTKYQYKSSHFSFDKLFAFIDSIMDHKNNNKNKCEIRFGTRSLPSKYGNPMKAALIDSMDSAVYAINTEYHNHIAHNPNMAVVIQYYARWSERCKAFSNDYRKIGAHFLNTTDVWIAKLNIVHNDPPFYIAELPQIVLYYKGKGKQYAVYDGIMHSTPIIQWITRQKQFTKHNPVHSFKLKFD